MDVGTFANKGFFDNWNEMFQAYYGIDPLGMYGNKVDAPYLTTTNAIRNIIYGAWLTVAFVTTNNALGAMRDAPWRKSGYRIVDDPYFGSTPDGDGVDQGGAIPYSTQDSLDILEFNPKTMSNVLDISTAELAMEGKDDTAKWAELVDVRRKTMMLNWNRNFLGYAAKTAVASNKGLAKIDGYIASYDQFVNSGESPTSTCFNVGGQSRESAASVFDCYVKHFSGTKTPFALKHLDDMWVNCQPYWDDGSFAEKHWLTGVNTSARIMQLHMAQFRGKLDTAPVQFTQGGIKTLPGVGGLNLVNLYLNMPIVTDRFVDNHYTDALTGLEKVYLIDNNYYEVAVGQPIEYQESKEFLATGVLAKRGIFHAVMEMAMWKFGGHGKLQCIS